MIMHTPDTMATEKRYEVPRLVVEHTIALFRGGYILSFALVAIGILLALFRDLPLASELGTPKNIFSHARDFDPNGFIGLGIGVMILTPIIMTIEVAINFFRAGDSRFGFITGLVSLILIVTIGLAFT
jgi:uncharacterized membrane protein